MYLKRKIDEYLIHWKKREDHLPLIVRGARQVGKTESIRKFAQENYRNVVEINFLEEKQYQRICEYGYKVEDIIRNITILDPSKKFVPKETVIFFDEVQAYPDVTTALKFFKIDGGYDVICSGSMLGIHYRQISSVSVGYKEDYVMRSLDFEEFLWARGYPDSLIKDLLDHMLSLKPFSDLEMERYHALFMEYCMTGGMPAILKQYIEQNHFSGIFERQRQIVLDYQDDIRKYASGVDQTRIMNVFRHIPVQLARENKKFQISKVARGARFQDYRGCIEWLEDAGMIHICRCMEVPELPLKGNYIEDKYKIYFADTGLLLAMLDEETQEDLRFNRNIHTYKGGLFENIVGEALVKEGYELYYFKKENSRLEEDFFIRSIDHLIPVEVKANNGNAKTLRTLIQGDQYPEIEYGIKLIRGNIGFSDNVYTFPYFCTFLLKRYLKMKK